MADTVDVIYNYPPNWDGFVPDDGGWRRVIATLTCLSDGTGETDVTKIDISQFRTPSGEIPKRTVVEWIEWQVFGITVLLEWDRAPNAYIKRLNAHAVESSGREDYRLFGGLVDPGDGEEGDRTGDISLTTTNADSGDSYEITICVKFKNN